MPLGGIQQNQIRWTHYPPSSIPKAVSSPKPDAVWSLQHWPLPQGCPGIEQAMVKVDQIPE